MRIYERYFKRIIDIIISITGIIILSPVLVIASILIKKEDGGSILYCGVRVGKGGEVFRMFKFRTMVMNADLLGGSATAENDPRITRIGKKLRKYKIDEIPQLFNVLKGDMSIVGPRPETKDYIKLCTDYEKTILSIKPGITDWATVWNPNEGAVLSGYANPEEAYLRLILPKKIELQKKYVEDITFLNDMKIIMLTIGVLWKRLNPALEELGPNVK